VSEPDAPRRGLRLERLLPVACLVAAGLLIASELMTTFEFVPPGGEAISSQSAGDRHSYAQIVLAAGAIFALGAAVFNGSKPAAVAVAACGVIALLIFLLLDLPDANNIGTLDDARQSFFNAEAVPQPGFWLQLVGALGLSITGIALATLSPDQLQELRPGGEGNERRRKASRGRTQDDRRSERAERARERDDRPRTTPGDA
jgi:hypothetical protein